jgi:hypothetical protein
MYIILNVYILYVCMYVCMYVYIYIYIYNTVLEDGETGQGSGLKIFQLLNATRSLDVNFRVLKQEVSPPGKSQVYLLY